MFIEARILLCHIIRRETLTWQWEYVFYLSAERISRKTCESGES
jgi:hypothetical protein